MWLMWTHVNFISSYYVNFMWSHVNIAKSLVMFVFFVYKVYTRNFNTNFPILRAAWDVKKCLMHSITTHNLIFSIMPTGIRRKSHQSKFWPTCDKLWCAKNVQNVPETLRRLSCRLTMSVPRTRTFNGSNTCLMS